MLEALSDVFYDPAVFWGTPLILAALLEAIRRARTRPRGRRPPGSGAAT